MWSLDARHESPTAPTAVIPERVLYYFDGPQIFEAKFGFMSAIFAKFDEYEDSDLWIASFSSDKAIDLVYQNKISVRAAFLNGQSWVVQTDRNFMIERFWPCSRDEVAEDMLPDSGVALHPGLGRKPDSVEQAEAFFSVGFRGNDLQHGRIKFSTFRTLIDNAYDMARRALSPQELLNTKRSTFDYDILEPQLGSLIISLEKPSINEDRVAQILKESAISPNQIDLSLKENRQEFFKEVNELIGASKGNITDREIAFERLPTLRNVGKVLPSAHGLFQSVEFTAAFDDGTTSLYLDYETGQKLAEALVESNKDEVTEAGVIQIINAPSRTFTIKTDDDRQITCQIGWREYIELRKSNLYQEGAWAVVTGPILRRPRRDLLSVKGIPMIFSSKDDFIFR